MVCARDFCSEGGIGINMRVFLYCMESLNTTGQLHDVPMMSKAVQLLNIEAAEMSQDFALSLNNHISACRLQELKWKGLQAASTGAPPWTEDREKVLVACQYRAKLGLVFAKVRQ
jgi:hypothetical protein